MIPMTTGKRFPKRKKKNKTKKRLLKKEPLFLFLDKKQAVISDRLFFVNMLKYGVRTLKIPRKSLPGKRSYLISINQIARVTLPERRQRVHAYTWQGLPSTRAFTRRTLAFQVLLERLWEWDTLIPKLTPFPQKSHLAIVAPPLFYQKVNVRIIPNFCKKSKQL